ncbi:MAG: ABC transporter ATP-binding protein [Firmicutes bacterium]|nr:ABC transporter ATP-binding protein [Bacillota bacterium]
MESIEIIGGRGTIGCKKVILEVENLTKHFPLRRGIKGKLASNSTSTVKAVDGVSFSIMKGEFFGVVGESGCGKTTMGRTILRLLEPTKGKIVFKNTDLIALNTGQLKKIRTKMQIIYQDPYESMNPRLDVYRIISEPLRVQRIVKNLHDAFPYIKEVLEDVNMVPPEKYMTRYPYELSGGERQRVAIARALVLKPDFIVADEPVSMLDVSTRGGILNLMLKLSRERGVAFLYITHDLATARHVCHRIAVMYLGKIVEKGPTDDLVKHPLHPYTKALIEAVLVPDPKKRGFGEVLKGEIPSPIYPPSGCRLHPRCPIARDICKEVEPKLMPVDNNRMVACYFA